MGGGGDYYDRDVTRGASQTGRGFSQIAEQKLAKSQVSDAVLPQGRKLTTTCKSPLVFAFDVTGSMGDLPRVIYDKMPMVAGQLMMQEYLEDPQMSLAAIGDAESDRAPIQIGDFCMPRLVDEWLERLWLEGKGGGQARESYELTGYYYAYQYNMEGATTPVLIMTGDEGFRESIPQSVLRNRLGLNSNVKATQASKVWADLKKKFKGNVIMIYPTCTDGFRYCPSMGVDAVGQWQEALGTANVILLDEKTAIADVILGLIAIASGSRTLQAYLQDIRNRPLELAGVKYEKQSEARIKCVENSLRAFAASRGKGGDSAQKPLRRKTTRQTQNDDSDSSVVKKKDWQL